MQYSRPAAISDDPIALKLNQARSLKECDLRSLRALTTDTRTVPANSDIISEGAAPERVHVVLDGLACRYKLLPTGGRSIMALLIPGDFCDLHIAILRRMDHAIATITECEVAHVPRVEIENLVGTEPRIAKTLWWATLVDEAILREWLVSMGRRNAESRIAHLFCELQVRFKTIGRVSDDGSFDLPVNQETLADMNGVSLVHVNRVLGRLHARNLARTRGGRVKILDQAGLERLANFDPDYLHLNRLSGGISRSGAATETS